MSHSLAERRIFVFSLGAPGALPSSLPVARPTEFDGIVEPMKPPWVDPDSTWFEDAAGLGVTGYPSVFVHPAGLGGTKKGRSMTRKSGEWQVLAPRDYVGLLTAATGERFGAS
jgi:hypothetical protein